MNRNYSQPVGERRYRRIYAGFRGIDFANHPINVDLSRSPYSENLWVDKAGVLHKRYPFERVVKTDMDNHTALNNRAIYGLFSFHPPMVPAGYTSPNILVAHADQRLAFITGAHTEHPAVNWITDGIQWQTKDVYNGTTSSAFQWQDKLYFLDGNNIWQIAIDESQDVAYAPYRARTMAEVATAPETQIAGFYRAKEVTELDSNQNQSNTIEYEWQFGEVGEKNLFTNRRVNTFCGDGIEDHKKFYLDDAGLRVSKVEIYSPTSRTVTRQGSVDVKAGTNIRSAPRQTEGNIIDTISTAQTFTTYGKNGKWYEIVYKSQQAYVHQDRVTQYNPPSQQSSPGIARLGDWETVTSWTQGEDTTRNCTYIEFTTAPPAHPRGNGLPNIRVYCVPINESYSISNTFASEAVADAYGDYLCVRGKYLAIAIKAVKIRVSNTGDDDVDFQALTPGTDYTVQQVNGPVITNPSMPVYQSPDMLDEYAWNIHLTHKATAGSDYHIECIVESRDNIETVRKCNIYGKFGEYNNDRIFYTGEGTTRNRDWYSEPSDPTCVLENSYTDIGTSGRGIAGYLNTQSDMLIVKYDSGNSDGIFRRTASSDGDITVFPVKAYDGRGAVSSKALANINGEALYLSRDGVKAFTSSELGTKYGLQDRSYLLGDKLNGENLVEAQMGVWNDWLLITFPNGHCYVADTAQKTAPATTSEHGFEWFFWTDFPARNMLLHSESASDEFFFSTPHIPENMPSHIPSKALMWVNKKSVKYEDYPDGRDVGSAPYVYSAQWNTAQDGMEEPSMVKYIEARGAIISMTPDTQTIHMAIATDGTSVGDARWDDNYNPIDDDVDMIELHAAPDIPYIAINRRIPRFKHVQFIFKNNDPDTDGIGIINIEFQYRYGRYIK